MLKIGSCRIFSGTAQHSTGPDAPLKNFAPKIRRRQFPCALTIAGSDSGGGAGIQADLKTFSALGVHGVSAITCVTAQNPTTVRSVHPIPAQAVADQIGAIFATFPVRSVKTGMLFSSEIIHAVIDSLAKTRVPLIVDPVIVSTSGSTLLKPKAVKALISQLLPRATLATPNRMEAERLLGMTISSPEELRQAAKEFHGRFGCAALVKGGHLASGSSAVDFYYDGQVELLLEAPFVRGIATHGTGCTYSAAIAAYCALGRKLPEAVIAAKEFISNAIAASYKCGAHSVLNCLWNR
jgi:hydroxymethylpyrimidine kinase/phosphomethylpyrimidine kinase